MRFFREGLRYFRRGWNFFGEVEIFWEGWEIFKEELRNFQERVEKFSREGWEIFKGGLRNFQGRVEKFLREGWEISGVLRNSHSGWEIAKVVEKLFLRGWDLFGRGWDFFAMGWDLVWEVEVASRMVAICSERGKRIKKISGRLRYFERGSNCFRRGWNIFRSGWDFFGRGRDYFVVLSFSWELKLFCYYQGDYFFSYEKIEVSSWGLKFFRHRDFFMRAGLKVPPS